MKRTAFVSSLAGLVAGAWLMTAVHTQPAPVVFAQERPIPTSFSGVIRPVAPAVVNISTTRVIKTAARGGNPFGDDNPFGDLFGFGRGGNRRFNMPEERRSSGTGSGVIVSRDGYILTNNHVVEDANEVTVTMTDKREYTAKVIGTDPWSDIAVVKINASNLPVLPIGDSGKAQVGDIVFAIGSPLGLRNTVTMGIVSATGRAGLGIERFEDFIQTDASINPGNSGGALISSSGQLLGINTAILSGSGGNQGIGFAIPANMAREVMDQLIKSGKVTRGYIGVGVQEVTSALTEALKAPIGSVAITHVESNSPGARAGIEVGDVVTKINGEEITDVNAFRNRVARNAPGASLALTVARNGSPRNVNVTLGELPGTEGESKEQSGEGARSTRTPLDGVSVEALSPQVARQLQLPNGTQGVVISDLDQSSSAAQAGLQEGDVIQRVNNQPVTSVADFNRLVRGSGSSRVVLLVNRQGATNFVAIENKK